MLKKVKKIIIWGDSVAKGVIYDSKRDKYSILRENAVNGVAEETGVEIINRAKMGMTIGGGLELIEADIKRGVAADIALVEFGGNDSDFDWAAIAENPDIDHFSKTPLDEFEAKMRKIIEFLSLYNIKTVLATLPPIVSDKYFEFVSRSGISKDNILKWLGDKNRIYRYHERYSLLILKLAAEYKCQVLDFRSAFLAERSTNEYICDDGIHPNQAGQRLLMKTALLAL